MLALTIAAFALLLAINLRIGRSLLYPPAAFSAVWFGALLLLAIPGGDFLPVRSGTYALFVTGAVCFSAGALFVGGGLLRSSRPAAASLVRSPEARERLLSWGLGIVIVGLPLRLYRLVDLTPTLRLADIVKPVFWGDLRRAWIAEGDAGGFRAVSLTDNLVLLATFLAIASLLQFFETRRGAFRSTMLVACAALYHLSTAGRTGLVTLIGSLVVAVWLARRRAPLQALGAAGAAALAVFAFMAVFRQTGGDPRWGLARNAVGVAESAKLYAVGGIVAFDGALHEDARPEPSWSIWRPLLVVARKFDPSLEIPSLHAEYRFVTPSQKTNVYTMYWAYWPEYGALGCLLGPLITGGVLAWAFGLAWRGSAAARLVFALAAPAVAMTIFNEQLFLEINLYAKAALFAWALYSLPERRLVPRPPDR